MTPERRAAIIERAQGIGRMLRTALDAFRAAVEHDHKAAAAKELQQFLQKDHGKRLPKKERDRIQREIADEHRDRYREVCEERYSLRQLIAVDYQPVLDALLAEVQGPDSIEDAIRRRFPQDGRDAGAMLITGLLELQGRKDIRASILGRNTPENLARFQSLQNQNGGSPLQQIVLDAIEAQEIEALQSKWTFDPKDDRETTAARALDAAIAAAKQARVPPELSEVLDEVKQAASYATIRAQALKLRLLSPTEMEKAIKREAEGGDTGE